MDFVTIEYDRDFRDWVLEDNTNDLIGAERRVVFTEAAVVAELRWEALDIMQRYCFKVVTGPRTEADLTDPDRIATRCQGLRFLGVEARWGEYVAATKDQLVLGNPF